MKINKSILLKSLLIFSVILVFVISRFNFLDFPNFSPLYSLAVFCGAFITNKKIAYFIPFSILIISDSILGFYPDIWAVYLSFALSVFLGANLKVSKKLYINHISANLLSAITFYVVSNFGVWTTGYYTYSLSGLINCYVMAIPFFKSTALSYLIFSSYLFGMYYIFEPKLELSFAKLRK